MTSKRHSETMSDVRLCLCFNNKENTNAKFVKVELPFFIGFKLIAVFSFSQDSALEKSV